MLVSVSDDLWTSAENNPDTFVHGGINYRSSDERPIVVKVTIPMS